MWWIRYPVLFFYCSLILWMSYLVVGQCCHRVLIGVLINCLIFPSLTVIMHLISTDFQWLFHPCGCAMHRALFTGQPRDLDRTQSCYSDNCCIPWSQGTLINIWPQDPVLGQFLFRLCVVWKSWSFRNLNRCHGLGVRDWDFSSLISWQPWPVSFLQNFLRNHI
jgi:hypothetical protein